MSRQDRSTERDEMVREQIERRGVRDPRVLSAMRTIPREFFIPEELAGHAYEDRALPIGFDQTISQPYMVARMTELLGVAPGSRVLEIGTGSGFQAAILAAMGCKVFTIERIPELSSAAADRLGRLDPPLQAHFRVGDGSLGWPAEAPFDGILVTAGAPTAPEPLLMQLKLGGRLVVPIGSHQEQTLMRITNDLNGRQCEEFFPCRFVKLRGAAGWRDEGEGEVRN